MPIERIGPNPPHANSLTLKLITVEHVNTISKIFM